MTKDEALRLALEALETLMIERGSIYDQAITAIKEALAQPEPNYKKALEVWLDKTEWVQETVKPHELGMHRADVLKQRIEATLAQPEQEPVAWIWEKEDGYTSIETHSLSDEDMKNVGVKIMKPLYTTPPQRTWTGLTDKDRFELAKAQYGWEDLLFAAEAKLKEKNVPKD
jgi:hypothetical protein